MIKNIFFFGTPDIAVPSLQKINELSDYNIIGVGIFPDRKVGRKQQLQPCPVKTEAERLGLKTFEIKHQSDLIDLYETQNFDLAIVIAFGMIFPAEILKDEKFVNIHFSLLPQYRGASPVQSAILDGRETSGITFQTMVPELDAGKILLQKELPLGQKNTLQIWNDWATETAEMMPDFLEQYDSLFNQAKAQDETTLSLCGKFTKADGQIFPAQESAQTIGNKFRAFTPWPGIFIQTPKGDMKLTKINYDEIPESFALPCAEDSVIYIQEAQLPGKKPTPIKDILRGNPDLFTKPSL